MPRTAVLYDEDYIVWTEQQARSLRDAGCSGVNLPIDWENLAEEVESLGRSERHKLRSRIATIIEHLMKLEYATADEPCAGWRSTVRRTRDKVDDLLAGNRTLRGQVPFVVNEETVRVAKRVAADLIERGELAEGEELGLANRVYTEEQILRDWFPDIPD